MIHSGFPIYDYSLDKDEYKKVDFMSMSGFCGYNHSDISIF